jgi:beta-galactosidase
MWVMFDFASDARTEGNMPGITGFGLVTADRKTKKDAFFWYQANWSTTPVLHITGRRFVKRPDRVQEVVVYANADSVALRVNGTQLPAQTSTDRIFRWTGVVLKQGANRIDAVGTWAGQERVDSVTWEAP